MEKSVKISSLKDHHSDFAYWMTKTPEERLYALEFLRQQYITFNKNVQQGFQRVCTVINKKQG